MTEAQQRAAWARAVRRRQADMKEAERMKTRGWTCTPPNDEIQQYVESRRT